jgi:hypothetical protein
MFPELFLADTCIVKDNVNLIQEKLKKMEKNKILKGTKDQAIQTSE